MPGVVLAAVGSVAVTAPVDWLGVEDIPDTWAQCEVIRQQRIAWRKAPPRVRMWTNPPNGFEDEGLVFVGDCADNVSGSFPWRNKITDPGTGTLRLRTDHPVAKYLFQLAITTDYSITKANTVITVDHMGGAKRWSGFLKNWKLVKDASGVRYVDCTFIDDLQYFQFTLCPPNPVLPIELFQWPRDWPVFGPSKWCISLLYLLQIIRLNGNLYNIPPDPFDLTSWAGLVDWTSWQTFIDADPFDLDDSSLDTFFDVRMTRFDQAVADAMDDAQLTMTYRRVLTTDGESYATLGGNARNGAVVFKVVDNSGYYAAAGTGTGGALALGFERTITEFLDGGVETILVPVTDAENIQPDQYYEPGFEGTVPAFPWAAVIDGPYTSIQTSELTWSPATAGSVIVGGDNPLADVLAELTIEAIGDVAGFLLSGGFVDNAGDIAASVAMPFLRGCITAWDQMTNITRVENLGWSHLDEVFGQGANNNAWSLSAIIAFSAAFQATESQTAHVFTMGGTDAILPGLDFDIGNRIGSTDLEITNVYFVDQVEEMVLSWDYSQDRAHDYQVQVGDSDARLTQAQRVARLLAKFSSFTTDVGVHLVS
jgi:hypothetical protein